MILHYLHKIIERSLVRCFYLVKCFYPLHGQEITESVHVWQNETNQLIQQVDRTTTEGKRDFAILTLAASTGLRAGDIAFLTLTDIDWKKNELRMIQGKTDVILTLPLSKNMLAAVADYLLNGRPETTVAQVLGHTGIKATKQYISLDLEGLRKCVLRLDSIGGTCQ